jgi:hypothetical protein
MSRERNIIYCRFLSHSWPMNYNTHQAISPSRLKHQASRVIKELTQEAVKIAQLVKKGARGSVVG